MYICFLASLITSAVLKERSGLKDGSGVDKFLTSRLGNTWQYFLSSSISQPGSSVTAVSLVVLTDVYNPPKFKALANVFLNAYKSDLRNASVVQPYLLAFATDKWTNQTFDPRAAVIAPANKVIELLGVDVVAIWTAVLTKQRIVVHHPDPEFLAECVRSIPCIGAWHRQTWACIRPVCTPTALELADLKSQGFYVAGFPSQAAEGMSDLWDLYVDLNARSVTINDKSKHHFTMSKYHKQMGEAFVKSIDTSSAEGKAPADPAQAAIKVIMMKTKELLDQLNQVKAAQGGQITSAEAFPQSLADFFMDVANAEGLVATNKGGK